MRGTCARKDLIKGLQIQTRASVLDIIPPVLTDSLQLLSYFQLTSFAVRLPPAVAVGAPEKKRHNWNRMVE